MVVWEMLLEKRVDDEMTDAAALLWVMVEVVIALTIVAAVVAHDTFVAADLVVVQAGWALRDYSLSDCVSVHIVSWASEIKSEKSLT